jgi:hypothetical protein
VYTIVWVGAGAAATGGVVCVTECELRKFDLFVEETKVICCDAGMTSRGMAVVRKLLPTNILELFKAADPIS